MQSRFHVNIVIGNLYIARVWWDTYPFTPASSHTNACHVKQSLWNGLICENISVRRQTQATSLRCRKSNSSSLSCSQSAPCLYCSLSPMNETKDVQDVSNKIRLHVPTMATLQERKYACRYCHMKYTSKTYFLKHIVVHGKTTRKSPNMWYDASAW